MIKFFSIFLLLLVLLKFSYYLFPFLGITILSSGKEYITDAIHVALSGFVFYLLFTDRINFDPKKK